MIDARDGTVLRHGPDRRALGFAAVYVIAAPALAANAFELAPVVRWGLVAACLLVAGTTAVTLVRRAARTEVGAAGLVLRRPPRPARRYPWSDVEAFEAVDPGGDTDAGARAGRRVLMGRRGGDPARRRGAGGRQRRRCAARIGR